jgi:hypothetical protein
MFETADAPGQSGVIKVQPCRRNREPACPRRCEKAFQIVPVEISQGM